MHALPAGALSRAGRPPGLQPPHDAGPWHLSVRTRCMVAADGSISCFLIVFVCHYRTEVSACGGIDRLSGVQDTASGAFRGSGILRRCSGSLVEMHEWLQECVYSVPLSI